MKVVLVAGARPNFIKIAPIYKEINQFNNRKSRKIINPYIVHTGQHYDVKMSKIFFEELELPEPDVNLGVGSASHAVQTAKIMIEFEKICVSQDPDLIMVVGDVNSTLACSLVASKLDIEVAHVEAGLRSFDKEMPEEINRLLTDSISDHLFTTCDDANVNLKREGIPEEKIHFVGNVMIDSLIRLKPKTNSMKEWKKLGVEKGEYAVLTLHRPRNVDTKDILSELLSALNKISEKIPIIFPAHPRTKKRIEEFNLQKYFSESFKVIRPLGYLSFLNLYHNSKFVLTDSGGIQEETTFLGIPCLTLRDNTERPVTITEGTNTLVGNNPSRLITETEKILKKGGKTGKVPKLWDGRAAKRIMETLSNIYNL